MKRLVICGSPRAAGRSRALAEAVGETYSFCGDAVNHVNMSDVRIAPCTGCERCSVSERTPGIDDLYCIIADDMVTVRELMNSCDELTVVCPVYFSGAPSQFKAFIDRLQPYYYSTKWRTAEKRPAHLFVVGEGGDPHGFVPLVGEVRSALSVAGFSLETVHDWVGRVDADGSLRGSVDLREQPERLLTEGVAPASDYLFIEPAGIRPAAALSALKATLTASAACVSVRPFDELANSAQEAARD